MTKVYKRFLLRWRETAGQLFPKIWAAKCTLTMAKFKSWFLSCSCSVSFKGFTRNFIQDQAVSVLSCCYFLSLFLDLFNISISCLVLSLGKKTDGPGRFCVHGSWVGLFLTPGRHNLKPLSITLNWIVNMSLEKR